MPSPVRAHISLRVSTLLWMSPERCDDVLRLLDEYCDAIDEVAFFTSFTHPPLPLAELQRRAELLAPILPRFRALGLTTGINHLSTIGHLEENLEHSLDEPWQRMMDIDGGVCRGCYCPRDPRMREYIQASYVALAHTQPDFLWVDDDVRVEGHAPALPHNCFCDTCLAAFAATTGETWTRERLRAAFSGGTREERLALRRQWLAQNRQSVTETLEVIRTAVDTVNPHLPLGFMTTYLLYSGFAHDVWASALAGKHGIPVKWRPGGGFYTDEAPGELLSKAHAIGRQTAQVQSLTQDIQAEHENFPYQRLKKSCTIFASEIAAYIGAGCTGNALNLFGISADPVDEYLPYFQRVRANRAFFDQAVATFGASPCEGLWLAVTKDMYAAQHADGDWFSAPVWGSSLGDIDELAEIGIPLAYGPEGARVVLLQGDYPLAFSREELLAMLAGGVMLDGVALQRLHEMGLGAFTGFAVAGTKERDTLERFTSDPLNGRFAGWQRDCRPSFWPLTSYLLTALTPESRLLSELVDFTSRSFGPVSGVYENCLGGRIAVFGYYPWRAIQTLAKSSQLRAVLRWLSREELPAVITSYHKAALWCRRDAQGKTALLLMNASIDRAEGVRLALREKVDELRLTLMDGSTTVLSSIGIDGAYTICEIPMIEPWAAVLLSQK